MRFSFDLETFLIQPSKMAPAPVCVQFQTSKEARPELIHVRDPAFKQTFDYVISNGAPSDGSNVAFDWSVIAQAFPDWIPGIFDLYSYDRVECTQTNEKIGDIFEGRHDRLKNAKNYSLAGCAKRHLKIELDKTDPWRLRYGTLIDVPVSQWPEEAVSYALGDAVTEFGVWAAQHTRWQGETLSDRFRQARAAFWLGLMEAWGIVCDPIQANRFLAETKAELKEAREICQKYGIVRPNGTRDTKAAMRLMLDVCKAEGIEPSLTDAGLRDIQDGETVFAFYDRTEKGIKLDADAIKEVVPETDETHPLTAYSKVISATVIEGRAEIAVTGSKQSLHSRFDVLKETGRTSCTQGQWGMQKQNMPRKPGLRECVVPREGYVFALCDYSSFELCTWAQVCIWICGFSNLAEVLNSGRDPHTALGATLAGISYEEGLARKEDPNSDFSDTYRQTGKIGNFGYPGGMGPKTLVKQARAQYGVRMTIPQATNLRDVWRVQWAEQAPYFAHIRDLTKKGGPGFVRHFGSNRIRSRIPYTVAANSYFQGLAADAAKAAGWQIARECYDHRLQSPLFGCRIVNFIHDEYILEIPITSRENMAAAGERLAEVMAGVAQAWIPDVKIRTEPVLADRWSKKAKTKRGPDGLLEVHHIEGYGT